MPRRTQAGKETWRRRWRIRPASETRVAPDCPLGYDVMCQKPNIYVKACISTRVIRLGRLSKHGGPGVQCA